MDSKSGKTGMLKVSSIPFQNTQYVISAARALDDDGENNNNNNNSLFHAKHSSIDYLFSLPIRVTLRV